MRAMTVPLLDGLSVWSRLESGWPVECGATWLRAELGRVTPHQYLTFVSIGERPLAAATWLLLDGTEDRRGYAAYDLLLGSELECCLRGLVDHPSGLDEAIAKARAALTAAVVVPCATAVLSGSSEPAVLWDRDLPNAYQATALAHLVDAVSAAAGRMTRATAFTNVPDTASWAPLRQALLRARYQPAAQPPLAVFHVPSDGLPGILAGLSRGRRKSIHQEMRRFARAVDGIRVAGSERLLADDVVDLQWQRYLKYGHRTSRDSTVERLVRAQDIPDMVVLVAERDRRACAFHALVADHALRRLVSRFGGCEPNDYFAYFNVAYYEALRYAATHGFTELALGTESYGPKVARGARLQPRAVYVRGTDARLHAQIGRACAVRTSVEGYRLSAEVPDLWSRTPGGG